MWWVRHHGVYHQTKLNKIRVIFYFSEKCAGRSIKKELMTCPDLNNQIAKSLIKLRQDWNL